MEYIGNLWSPCSLHEQAKGGFITFGHTRLLIMYVYPFGFVSRRKPFAGNFSMCI